MVVRGDGRTWCLFRQHDHGRAAGEIAAAWAAPLAMPAATVLATANHDVAWEALDTGIAWDAVTGRPISFADGRPEPRLEAYRRGIDLVEAADPFAACLCSMHYASFFAHVSSGPLAAFVRAERDRQARLLTAMTPTERDGVEDGLRVLQFCDGASLFICRNAPGRNECPEYREGIPWGTGRIRARWHGDERVDLTPSPLAREVTLRLPYLVTTGPDRPTGAACLVVRMR